MILSTGLTTNRPTLLTIKRAWNICFSSLAAERYRQQEVQPRTLADSFSWERKTHDRRPQSVISGNRFPVPDLNRSAPSRASSATNPASKATAPMALGIFVMPATATMPVQVRLHQNLLEAIENWRREQESIPSRPEAIRRLLQQRLTMPAQPSMAA
jgi:hypothetical protein